MSHQITEVTFRVGSLDVDMFNQCRPSALLGYLQEAATQAAIQLGASGPEIFERYHCLWMVSRNWVELYAPLRWNDAFTIQTWHRGGTGVATYRDFDIFRDGKLIGQGVAQWVMVDADTHKLFRLRDVTEFQGTDGGELCKSRTLSGLHLPAHMEHVESRALHYSDTDVNGHVNNVRYVDFICDALHMENLGPERYVSSLQVGYLAECRAGETIELCAGQEDGIWYVHGADPAGKSRFDGAVELSHITP